MNRLIFKMELLLMMLKTVAVERLKKSTVKNQVVHIDMDTSYLVGNRIVNRHK